MAHNTLLTFIFIGFFFLMNSLKSQDPLGLARPRLSSSMAMITSEPPVLHADFRMEGAVLRYTTDGTVPDLHSPVMQSELKVRFPATIRVRAFHPDFQASEAAEATFFLPGKELKSLVTSPAHARYSGPANILTDHKFGDSDFSQQYLGFNKDTVALEIQMDAWVQVKKLHFTGLLNAGAWISTPQKILVLDRLGSIISSFEMKTMTPDAQSGKWHAAIDVRPGKYGRLTVKIPPCLLPDWHEGKGTTAWIFLDECWVE